MLVLVFATLTSQAAQVEDLKWLAGTWRSESSAGTYENIFSDPSGGLILGLTKMVDPQTHAVSFYEYDQIKTTEAGLVLSPMPFGQPGVSFTAVEISNQHVIFENAQHEFPRRITYEINSAGQLVSTVEGTQGGRAVKMQFVMQKK